MGDFDWIICHLSLLITVLQIWRLMLLSDFFFFLATAGKSQMFLHYVMNIIYHALHTLYHAVSLF